jgi:hypothetical protein
MINNHEYITLDTHQMALLLGCLTAQWILQLHQLKKLLLVKYDMRKNGVVCLFSLSYKKALLLKWDDPKQFSVIIMEHFCFEMITQ